MKIVVFAFILASSQPSWARISPAWISTPAHEPNIELLMHESGARVAFDRVSYVAVQSFAADDPKANKLIADVKSSVPAISDLLPHHCYELRRKKRATRQTWCEGGKSGKIFSFIEAGPIRMKENEIRELQLRHLEGVSK